MALQQELFQVIWKHYVSKDMLIRANAIGAIQVQTLGDNEGLPNIEELNAYLKKSHCEANPESWI